MNYPSTSIRENNNSQTTVPSSISAVLDNAGARKGAYFVVGLFLMEAFAGLLWYISF